MAQRQYQFFYQARAIFSLVSWIFEFKYHC